MKKTHKFIKNVPPNNWKSIWLCYKCEKEFIDSCLCVYTTCSNCGAKGGTNK